MKIENDNKEKKNVEKGIADKEWDKIVETLKLIASPGLTISIIAGQVDRGEKWVRNLKKKALTYNAACVSTLPIEVQGYIIDNLPTEKKSKLIAELGKIKMDRSPISFQPTCPDIPQFKHWEDLAHVAKVFENVWDKHLESGMTIQGYIIDDYDFEPFSFKHCYVAKQLLSHLKAEFSSEFETISDWKELLREPLPHGVFEIIERTASRRTFQGTCEICRDWKVT